MRNRWPALCLAALVACAAALRLAQLDLVSVTADEGLHGMSADMFARDGVWTLAGQPSVGIHNTPLFIYTLSLPWFVATSPLAGVVWIAAFQLAALALAWHWGRKWFGAPAAAIACLLLAASPWMTLYARNMWPPSAVMPLGMALVGLGGDWLRQGGGWRLCGMAALAFVLPAMHFSGFVAPVWTLGVLIAGGRNRLGPGAARALALGVFVGLIPWLPWLYLQQFVLHWNDLRGLGGKAGGKPTFAPWLLVEYFGALLHAGGLEYWFKDSWSVLRAGEPAAAAPLRAAGAGLMLAGLALAGWQTRHADPLRRALWAWTLVPFAMLLLLRPELHPHYLLVAFPIPFLLIGDALARWATTTPRRAAVAAGLALVVAGHLLTLEGVRRFLDAGLLRGGNRYQLTYRQRRAAAAAAVDELPFGTARVAGFFNGEQPSYHWLYLAEARRRPSVREADYDHAFWFDEDSGVEFSALARTVLRKRWPDFAKSTIERVWHVGPCRIVRLRRGPANPPP